MPNSEQIESVMQEIESLQAWQGQAPLWSRMTNEEKRVALGEIEFAGFTQEEEAKVIGKVLAGEAPELWMEGMDDAATERAVAELERGWAEGNPVSPDEVTQANNAIFADMMRDISNPPRFDEVKRYEVWHADITGASQDFPEAYTRAAIVQAESLEHAVKLTTHIDKPWQENPGVEGDGYRSTGIGDVVVDPQGKAHRFGEQGFHQISRGNYERAIEQSVRQGALKSKDVDRGPDR